MSVTTLKDVHEVLTKLMPAPNSAAEVVREYYLRMAEVYGRVAEVDRAHHHEALCWAEWERAKGGGQAECFVNTGTGRQP